MSAGGCAPRPGQAGGAKDGSNEAQPTVSQAFSHDGWTALAAAFFREERHAYYASLPDRIADESFALQLEDLECRVGRIVSGRAWAAALALLVQLRPGAQCGDLLLIADPLCAGARQLIARALSAEGLPVRHEERDLEAEEILNTAESAERSERRGNGQDHAEAEGPVDITEDALALTSLPAATGMTSATSTSGGKWLRRDGKGWADRAHAGRLRPCPRA